LFKYVTVSKTCREERGKETREEMGSHENSERGEETWNMSIFVLGQQSGGKEYQAHLLSEGV